MGGVLPTMSRQAGILSTRSEPGLGTTYSRLEYYQLVVGQAGVLPTNIRAGRDITYKQKGRPGHCLPAIGQARIQSTSNRAG